MIARLGRDWSCRAGRRAVDGLLAIGENPEVDMQVRVNALSTVLQCCGEDVAEGPTEAVGFRGRGEG